MTTTYHKPVLLEESIDALEIRPDGTYVDVTFGGGGQGFYSLFASNSHGFSVINCNDKSEARSGRRCDLGCDCRGRLELELSNKKSLNCYSVATALRIIHNGVSAVE